MIETQLVRAKKRKSRIIDLIYLFMCGFFVFSPLSSFISLTIFKLPLAIPELLFIPFYFRLKKIFDLSGMNKIISIYDTHEQAISSL